VLVVMEKGKIVRSRVDEVNRTGRNTMGVKFATPDKRDSIVAVARNADRGIEDEDETDEDTESDSGPGIGLSTSGDVPTVTSSVPESPAETGTVASGQNEADNVGGSE